MTDRVELIDDPIFIAWVEDFVKRHDVSPAMGDIMMFIEARASIALDKDETQ